MQVFGFCVECFQKNGRPNGEAFTLPYYDERIAYVTCSQGHKSALLVQSPKFEVLLESGANALIDGYTMEAAASFSAALERFYEFCVLVFCTVRNLPTDLYEQMFKEMSRQSERQIWAFLVLHASELGSAYKLNPKITEFRNSVIHKGRIPTPEEAEAFCEKVYMEIRTISNSLLAKFPDAYNKVIGNDLIARSAQLPKDMPRATTAKLSLVRPDKDFKDALQEHRTAREKMNIAPLMLKLAAPLLASMKGIEPPSPSEKVQPT